MDEPLAKPDQGLLEHLREVARRGERIARRLDLSKDLKDRAILACWLHDVGKALPSFQKYMKAVRALELAWKGDTPSAEELERLRETVSSLRARAYPHALAALAPTLALEQHLLGEPFLATAAVVSHHSPLTASLFAHRERPPESPETLLQVLKGLLATIGITDQEVLQFISKLLQHSPAGLLDDPKLGLRKKFQALPRKDFAAVKTVLHLADWTASAKKDPEELFLSQGKQKLQAYLEKQRKRKPFELRGFQKQAAKASGMSLTLQAPTGTGKTEALLLWAGDTERILYFLPTQATVNAMWKRLQGIYGETAVGLAHSRSGYILHKTFGEEDPLDHRLFGSAFAQPVVVATLDQYLIGHLQGRHWEERLTLSEQAAVIFDEIHAYEPFTLGLLKEALAKAPPRHLALASATLPSPLKALFPTETEIQAEPALWDRKRYHITLQNIPIEESLSAAVEAARSGKAVLLIANTVRKAQSLYRILKDRHKVPAENLKLLHSRFIFRDRMAKEEAAHPQPGTLLIATQVVEVSLDISYDSLFTEIAPLDALVQRMGRVNRDGRHPPAPVTVFTKWDQGSRAVYGEGFLQESLVLLENLPPIPTDGQLAEVTDTLYQRIANQESYQEELELGREHLRELQGILGCYTLDLSDEKLRAYFVTRRRGDISIDVLPRSYLDEAQALVEEGKRWRLTELLVPVPAYWLSRYWGRWFWPSQDLGVYVADLPYDPDTGLQPPEEDQPSSSYEFA